ncbi:hypothetical protein [Glycomyces dulcitolivorans]|uniref:hypothetical protein n=1 Tax=Glycomyces dulcitolivorans TaxID=2200759 RepID=UPI0013005447|nr:hypothetical protein [Glycomyces dulcitolivorans]
MLWARGPGRRSLGSAGRDPLVRRRGDSRAFPVSEKKEPMPDLAYLALTVLCFIVLGLLVKAVEKL